MNPYKDKGRTECSLGHSYICSLTLLKSIGSMCGKCLGKDFIISKIVEFRKGKLLLIDRTHSSGTKFTIECEEKHIFSRHATDLKNGGYCEDCDRKNFQHMNSGARFTKEKMIEEFKKIHGDEYDYSKINRDYLTTEKNRNNMSQTSRFIFPSCFRS